MNNIYVLRSENWVVTTTLYGEVHTRMLTLIAPGGEHDTHTNIIGMSNNNVSCTDGERTDGVNSTCSQKTTHCCHGISLFTYYTGGNGTHLACNEFHKSMYSQTPENAQEYVAFFRNTPILRQWMLIFTGRWAVKSLVKRASLHTHNRQSSAMQLLQRGSG